MFSNQIKIVSRIGLMLLIMLSGFAILPFTQLSAEQLDWRTFAGLYQPELNVNEDSGAPGSSFFFQATGYPAEQIATVYINGVAAGTLYTDGVGAAAFVIQTHPRDSLGSYQISLATDINTTATKTITLNGDSVVPPPPDFNGRILPLNYTDTFLPVIKRQ